MKKLFLILAAAVVLSSLAFAKPYGEKSRPDSVGDIVFADGTATAWREWLTLTGEQKKAAVAVIFYAGTECSNSGERRVLGVGLKNATGSGNTLEWARYTNNADKAEGYSTNITAIQCTPSEQGSGKAATATFTSDLNGSDNWQALCEAVSDEGTGGNYPAWEWVNAYATTANLTGDYASGWYLPTLAELCMLYRAKDIVNAALEAAGGTKIADTGYWSSSQSSSYFDYAWIVWFDDGFLSDASKFNDRSVCGVRAFNGEEKTMTVRENLKLRSGEATSTQVLAVMSAGAKVRILELGRAETIDGIPSNWVKVEVQQGAKDRDGKPIKGGTVGWCFGGYLE